MLFLLYLGVVRNVLVDLPCYSAPEVQDDFRNKIWKSCRMKKSSIGNTEIVKILAPLTDNPNTSNNNGETPSEIATNTEIKEIILKYSAAASTKPSKKYQ